MYTVKFFKADSRFKGGRRLIHQQDYTAADVVKMGLVTFQEFEQNMQDTAQRSGWHTESYAHHVPRGNLITG
jgi:hypothetical protein